MIFFRMGGFHEQKTKRFNYKIFICLLIGLVVGILVYSLPPGTFKDDIFNRRNLSIIWAGIFKGNYDDGCSSRIYFTS